MGYARRVHDDAAALTQELEAELTALTPEQRDEVARELATRARAAQIAAELGLDPHDVRLVLKCLALPPSERLRRGLIGGRRHDVAE